MELSGPAFDAQQEVRGYLEILEEIEDEEDYLAQLSNAPIVKIDDSKYEWALYFSPGDPGDTSEDVGWSTAPQFEMPYHPSYEDLGVLNQHLEYLGPPELSAEEVVTRLIEVANNWTWGSPDD